MRKIALGMAVAASALAAPAMARDGQAYIEADIGAIIENEFDVGIEGFEDAASIDHTDGWDLGGIIGYDFGIIRTELEGSYKEGDPDTIVSTARGIPFLSTTPVTGTFDPVAGELQLTSVMANALVDFGGEDGVGFSAGVGAGHVWADANYIAGVNFARPFAGYLDDSDHDWAWQAIAQIRIPVTEDAEIGLKYRYFNTKQFEMVDTIGRANAFEIASHSALVTFTANLGSEPPPPPPPVVVPPPPPPPPPVAAPPPPPRCNQGPYIVFFDWDKSDVTTEAATILNNAVTAYANCGTAAIMLAGHTDKSGSAEYNVGLAQRRNASVQTYLAGRGIPAARITSQAFGESMPRVPTADGVRELQNRRVEVTYGPGSGR